MDNIYKVIGNKIRELRFDKEMSQETLAEKSGMRQGNLSRVELGKHGVQLDTLIRIAKGLNISVKELIPE